MGTAAAEALAKLVLRRGSGALASAPNVVAKLLAAYFGANARRRPRLAQCLAVFFPALASAPVDRRRLIADAALPALRAAAAEKGIARVASFLAHLLTCAPPEEATPATTAAITADEEEDAAAAAAMMGPAPAAGGDVLVATLVKEALAVTLRPTPRGATAAEKALTKAYVAALAKLAAAVPLGRTDTIHDAEERATAEASLARGASAATLAGGRVTEKTTAGLFASAAEKMRTAAGLGDGSELAEEAEEGVAEMVLQECRALADSDDLLPAAGAKKATTKKTTTMAKTTKTAAAAAGGRRRRSGSAERDDDSEDEEGGIGSDDDDDEENENDESPASPPSRARREETTKKRASKTASAKDVEPAAVKTTRSTRSTRAALKENVAAH